jgi:hypothetical protein
MKWLGDGTFERYKIFAQSPKSTRRIKSNKGNFIICEPKTVVFIPIVELKLK